MTNKTFKKSVALIVSAFVLLSAILPNFARLTVYAAALVVGCPGYSAYHLAFMDGRPGEWRGPVDLRRAQFFLPVAGGNRHDHINQGITVPRPVANFRVTRTNPTATPSIEQLEQLLPGFATIRAAASVVSGDQSTIGSVSVSSNNGHFAVGTQGTPFPGYSRPPIIVANVGETLTFGDEGTALSGWQYRVPNASGIRHGIYHIHAYRSHHNHPPGRSDWFNFGGEHAGLMSAPNIQLTEADIGTHLITYRVADWYGDAYNMFYGGGIGAVGGHGNWSQDGNHATFREGEHANSSTPGGRLDVFAAIILVVPPELEEGGIRVIKTCALTGDRLPGTGFHIYNAENQFVASGFTNNNGEWIYTGLIPGWYRVTEVIPPHGFLLSEESSQLVEVSANAVGNVDVLFENEPDLPPEIITQTPPGTLERMEWDNQPLAFAEVKQGTFSDNRSTEAWEAMAGTPTTETLYINAGGTNVYIDIVAHYRVDALQRRFTARAVPACSGGGCDPCAIITPYGIICGCTCGATAHWSSDRHYVRYTYIYSIGFREAQRALLSNSEIFVNGTEIVDISGSIQVNGQRSLIPYRAGGTSHNFGAMDGNVEYSRSSGGHPCGAPFQRIARDLLDRMLEDRDPYLFVQSESLVITIDGISHEVIRQNKITTIDREEEDGRVKIFGTPYDPSEHFQNDGETPLDTTREVFLPITQNWCRYTHIEKIGYNGMHNAGAGRNNGLRFYRSGIAPPLHQVNGMFHFHNLQNQNVMEYNSNMQTLIPNPFNTPARTNQPQELPITLQYTNWRLGGAQADRLGPNPIIFHNPVSAQQIWARDIPESVLQDQRIESGNFGITPFSGARDSAAPTRHYIDYVFSLVFGNTGAFGNAGDTNVSQTYFGFSAAGGSSAVGQRGLLNPITQRGGSSSWGFTGDYTPPNTQRSVANGSNAKGLDTSIWVNSKFVKFSIDVRWVYGGDVTGNFYPAGTWIRLYNDGYQAIAGDPSEFAFHITSNVRDSTRVRYYYLVEAINVPAHLRGNPEALWASSQQIVNSLRGSHGYIGIGGTPAEGGFSARHSAGNMTGQDIIGRIGNVIVDDSSDPRWGTTFWNESANWLIPNLVRQPDTNTPVSRYFSISYGMFEENNEIAPMNPNHPRFNDRWGGLNQFHNAEGRLGDLPVMRGDNITPGMHNQTIKMGYQIQFSVQTLGDHDGEMHVIPDFALVGNFAPLTGLPQIGDRFALFAPETQVGNVIYREFWNTGMNPYNYVPGYRHVLSHSLASPRAKINEHERQTGSFQLANATSPVYLGTPSFIRIPRELRTFIGSNNTHGHVLPGGVQGMHGQPGFSRNDNDATYNNAQRWHGRFSLPSGTLVGVRLPGSDANSEVHMVPKTFDQYIAVYMTFRTWNGEGALWDLTTLTNSMDNPVSTNGMPDFQVEIPPFTPAHPNLPDGVIIAPEVFWPPHRPRRPRVPIAIIDYSNDSSTDAAIVGTH